jgi:hypothetical protein
MNFNWLSYVIPQLHFITMTFVVKQLFIKCKQNVLVFLCDLDNLENFFHNKHCCFVDLGNVLTKKDKILTTTAISKQATFIRTYLGTVQIISWMAVPM